MTLPLDCIAVGFAILVFSILLWGAARMIDRRLGHMEMSLTHMEGTLVNIGQSMTAALHAIERFLDRQEARDLRDRPQSGPAE
jgi:hypothetical protein